MGFNPQEEIEVDRSMHKNFVFGNNQSSAALGLSHVNAGLCGSEITLQAHMVEGGTPFLLSSKFLYDMKATINFRTGFGSTCEVGKKSRESPHVASYCVCRSQLSFECYARRPSRCRCTENPVHLRDDRRGISRDWCLRF